MPTKISVHQPEYWPIPRLLAKWAQVDLLIILDTVQFNRESLQHRCKLASPDGQLRWLTIPFRHNGSRVLRDLTPSIPNWIAVHTRTISDWYRFADPDRLNTIMNFYRRHRGASIVECAESSMIAMSQLARIDVPVQRLSSLTPPDGHWGGKADMVLNACRAVGADTYLSGLSGATYLEPHESKFARAGVKIEVQSYPVAVEVPGLSSLHTYLLHGEERLRELVRHT